MMLNKVIVITILCALNAALGQEFKNHIVADNNGIYHIYWNVEGDTVTFKLEVKTTGFVGFGFSPNGGMPGSDMIIGWVYSNGTAVFHDRHAIAFAEPPIDDHQDYTLLKAFENGTHTILQFSRKLDTCDPDDRPITDDTTKLIYSWSDVDPVNKTGFRGHGPNRKGSRDIYILSTPAPLPQVTEDVTVWDVQIPNVDIPAKRTSYWCVYVKLPDYKEPHEYIGFKMNITPGNEQLIHHFLFYECNGDAAHLEEKVKNKNGFECVLQGTVAPPPECQPPIIAWAIGSPGQTVPNNVGIPVGANNGGTSYYMMQMHYNNLEKKAGIKDSTIMHVYLTKKPREIKGSSLQMASRADYTLVIPPLQPAFKVATHCPSACTSQAFPPEGITVYAAVLHAHYLGRKIAIRHFRGESELKPIVVDNNFDFDYQELRLLLETVNVLPGDHLVTTCEYDSTNRTATTPGGYGTDDEMCFVYLQYYPAIPLSICIGGPSYASILQFYGVEGLEADQYHIKAPEPMKGQSMFDVVKNYNWKAAGDAKLKKMTFMQLDGPMDMFCINGRSAANKVIPATAEFPNGPKYTTEDECKKKTTKTTYDDIYY